MDGWMCVREREREERKKEREREIGREGRRKGIEKVIKATSADNSYSGGNGNGME
jgi:hypothetical protein